ncbi:extracellular solute-binding protein [Algihabitans albus]|uniref:extracellular solute-binding protein n=1 Tax=Algihabitans albus TaxID=2164067 RepID=UPI0035CE8C8F
MLTRLLAATAVSLTLTAPAAAEQIELRVHYALPQLFNDIQEGIAAGFMAENPDVKIVFDAPAEEYEQGVQRLLRESIAGTLPDIAYVGLNRWRVLQEREIAVPLNAFMGSADELAAQGYTPALLSLGRLGDTQYAMAVSASTPVMYVNSDLVAQAGGSMEAFPSDWDGLIELGSRINALGGDIDGLYYHFWGSDWMWQALLGSHGGRPLTEDEGDIAIDSAAGMAAAELLARFRAEADMPSYDRAAAQQAFAAGKLGIYFDSSSFLARVEEAVGDRFPVRLVEYPITAEASEVYLPTGGSGIAILTDDPARQEAAWRYITWATGPKGATVVVENSGYAPTNAIVVEDESYLGEFYAANPNAKVAHAQLAKYAGPWYAFPGAGGVKVTDTIMKGLRDVIDQTAAPDVKLNEVAAQVRSQLDM